MTPEEREKVREKHRVSLEKYRHQGHAFLSSGVLGRNFCDKCGASFGLHKELPYGGRGPLELP